ncbi:hypothetical protein MKEN_00218900 [Mycena kentingensis (nom. inval.)]|nr:hypothetical protein MKEN_00218900 [Mycena kentingensis (nom. inval.)]
MTTMTAYPLPHWSSAPPPPLTPPGTDAVRPRRLWAPPPYSASTQTQLLTPPDDEEPYPLPHPRPTCTYTKPPYAPAASTSSLQPYSPPRSPPTPCDDEDDDEAMEEVVEEGSTDAWARDWLHVRAAPESAALVAEKTCEMICYLWFAPAPASSSQTPTPLQLIPTPQFVAFTQKLLETTQLSQSAIVLALHFIHRLRTRNRGIPAQEGSEFRVCVAGLMLANKMLDDNTYTNATWASVSSIPLEQVNTMEREFLVGIEHGLHGLSVHGRGPGSGEGDTIVAADSPSIVRNDTDTPRARTARPPPPSAPSMEIDIDATSEVEVGHKRRADAAFSPPPAYQPRPTPPLLLIPQSTSTRSSNSLEQAMGFPRSAGSGMGIGIGTPTERFGAMSLVPTPMPSPPRKRTRPVSYHPPSYLSPPTATTQTATVRYVPRPASLERYSDRERERERPTTLAARWDYVDGVGVGDVNAQVQAQQQQQLYFYALASTPMPPSDGTSSREEARRARLCYAPRAGDDCRSADIHSTCPRGCAPTPSAPSQRNLGRPKRTELAYPRPRDPAPRWRRATAFCGFGAVVGRDGIGSASASTSASAGLVPTNATTAAARGVCERGSAGCLWAAPKRDPPKCRDSQTSLVHRTTGSSSSFLRQQRESTPTKIRTSAVL